MGRVYDERHIKSRSIEGVLPNLRQSGHAYCRSRKRAELKTLEKYADSLTALRGLNAGPSQTSKKKGDR